MPAHDEKCPNDQIVPLTRWARSSPTACQGASRLLAPGSSVMIGAAIGGQMGE